MITRSTTSTLTTTPSPTPSDCSLRTTWCASQVSQCVLPNSSDLVMLVNNTDRYQISLHHSRLDSRSWSHRDCLGAEVCGIHQMQRVGASGHDSNHAGTSPQDNTWTCKARHEALVMIIPTSRMETIVGRSPDQGLASNLGLYTHVLVMKSVNCNPLQWGVKGLGKGVATKRFHDHSS